MRITSVIVAVLLLAAPAVAGQIETRYWFGAQLGVQTTISFGDPWEVRYRSFSGVYVADVPSYRAETSRITLGIGSMYAGIDHVAWGAPFSVSFDSLVLGTRGATQTMTWDMSWLPTGWDVAVGFKMGDVVVGYTEQRRFGGGCAQFPYCDNSGPYLEVTIR
jgi:hypothetical protein